MKKKIKNLKISALVLGVCAAALLVPVHNAQADAFTPEQKKEIEVLFKKFLAENGEGVLQSVESFRAEQEKKSQQSAQENLKIYEDYFARTDLPMAGNPKGDVTIVEFFDYNCGYCRRAFADIMTLLDEDKNLRVVFQEMPILSPSSQTMTNLALAAHKQGKYFEMHKALMDYKGTQSDEAYYKLAESVGLDLKQLKTDAASQDIAAEMMQSSTMAKDLGIRGTPGFVIGGQIYPGYIGLDGLREAVKEARTAKASE